MVKKFDKSKKEIEEIKSAVSKLKSKKKYDLKLEGTETSVNKGTLKIVRREDIAMDFATKAYQKFDKIIKSIVLFGSSAKGIASPSSDIDIMMLIDDCSVQWDEELIAWYREELGKLIKENPYQKPLHISTIKLTSWWNDMLRGEPLIVNIIRNGEALIDFGGFFNPLKVLLGQGKIKNTAETIYLTLGRAPAHLSRSKTNILSSIEGLYWAFVDSAHSALMAANISPPSPEHIPRMLMEEFVEKKILKKEYVAWYEDIYHTTHRIFRNELTDINGKDIDVLTERAEKFVKKMAEITDELTG